MDEGACGLVCLGSGRTWPRSVGHARGGFNPGPVASVIWSKGRDAAPPLPVGPGHFKH